MNLGTTRLRGRPRNRWQDEVREDGRIVSGEVWQEKVHDREEWKKLLRTARNRRILHTPMNEWIKFTVSWQVLYLPGGNTMLFSSNRIHVCFPYLFHRTEPYLIRQSARVRLLHPETAGYADTLCTGYTPGDLNPQKILWRNSNWAVDGSSAYNLEQWLLCLLHQRIAKTCSSGTHLGAWTPPLAAPAGLDTAPRLRQWQLMSYLGPLHQLLAEDQ